MTLLVYENSWEGFLSAVFQAFRLNGAADMLRNDCFSGDTMFQSICVPVAADQADRVQRGMERLGSELSSGIYQAWLSEKPRMETDIVTTLRLGFEKNCDPLPLLQYPEIKRVAIAMRHVGREAHRFLGLTRLKHVHDDLYAADFTHDYNLLPLMGEHFCMRFGDQRIIIRDIERRKALVTGHNKWQIAELPEGEIAPLPEDGMFEKLWRGYFETFANPARKNLKLQQKFVPLKYRAHLTEFQGTEFGI